MPYVVTTGKSFDDADSGVGGVQVESRHAVATLDEAREMVSTTVCDLMAGENFGQYQDQFRAIDEAGGKVGPLNDDTVIEVAEMVNEFGRPDVRGYLRGWHFPAAMSDAEIIDAYNAAQQED